MSRTQCSSDSEEGVSGSEASDQSKRPKSKPFSDAETKLLLEFVQAKKGVIESKETGFGSNQKKAHAWEEIAKQFNSEAFTCSRSGQQLRKRWENLKAIGKKEVLAHKKAVKKTGGGPPPPPVSTNTEKVLALVPGQMVGLESEFDSDAPEKIITGQSTSVRSPVRHAKANSISQTVPIPNRKSSPKRKHTDPRTNLAEWEFEEHKLRMKTLEVAHEFEIERVKKIRLEQECLKQEHELKLKLLLLQIQNLTGVETIVMQQSDCSLD